MGSSAGGKGLALLRLDRIEMRSPRHRSPPAAFRSGSRMPDWIAFRHAGRYEGRVMSRAIKHADGTVRCPWPKEDIPLYVAYHDNEWGVPEYDDRALYEKLMLDGFQAGLSWITILRKRDNFRNAFDDFDPEKIARYTPKKIAALMQDAGIVRNRAKIEGAMPPRASGSRSMEKGDGFSNLLWGHLDGRPKVNMFKTTKSGAGRDAAVAARCRRNSPRADSNSSGRRSSMPSCRRSAWSTTIS